MKCLKKFTHENLEGPVDSNYHHEHHSQAWRLTKVSVLCSFNIILILKHGQRLLRSLNLFFSFCTFKYGQPFLYAFNFIFHLFQKYCFSCSDRSWGWAFPIISERCVKVVQTFLHYSRYEFYFMNLSLLGVNLARFRFCWFSGLFWPFFRCKIGPKFTHKFMAGFSF